MESFEFQKFILSEINRNHYGFYAAKNGDTIARIVEEINRLKIYSEKGDIIYINIPPDIEAAAKKLKNILENN